MTAETLPDISRLFYVKEKRKADEVDDARTRPGLFSLSTKS